MNRTKGGWRVPDQNLWTGEVLTESLTFAWDPLIGDVRLAYEDPMDDDWEHGVLWLRHGQDRSGTYKWRAINTPRTRLMLREHLCMVCSGSCVRKKDKRTYWLFVDDPATAPDGTPITNLPPTCLDCIPEALLTCPRLIERARLVTVAETTPYAVTADVYAPGEGSPPPAVKKLHEVNVPYVVNNALVLRCSLGKQPWVALEDMRDEPLPRL